MNRLLIILLLAGVLVVGCASPWQTGRAQFDREWFWMPIAQYDALVRERDRLTPKPPEGMVNFAADSTKERSDRCQSVFSLFASYIRCGYDSKAVFKVIGDPKWLGDANLISAGASGGQLPIYSRMSDSEFCLYLLPDENGWSDWVIYFTVSRSGNRVLDAADARAFLCGSLQDREVLLTEFALCYPDRKIRRFTKEKVWLLCHGDFR